MHKAYVLTATAVAAAVLVATILTAPALASVVGPGWAQATGFGVDTNSSENLTKLSVTTNGDIPSQPDSFIEANAVTGFAWVDFGTGKVYVATIHPTFRDSAQNPDAWHAHTATLTEGTRASDFCVATIDSTPTAGINIAGSGMTVNTSTDKLPVAPGDIDGATGFVINVDRKCPESNFAGLHLGVNAVTP